MQVVNTPRRPYNNHKKRHVARGTEFIAFLHESHIERYAGHHAATPSLATHTDGPTCHAYRLVVGPTPAALFPAENHYILPPMHEPNQSTLDPPFPRTQGPTNRKLQTYHAPYFSTTSRTGTHRVQ